MRVREDKFIELFQDRMTRILTIMISIANLSNNRYYEFSQDEINELFNSYEEMGKKYKEVFTNNLENSDSQIDELFQVFYKIEDGVKKWFKPI